MLFSIKYIYYLLFNQYFKYLYLILTFKNYKLIICILLHRHKEISLTFKIIYIVVFES